MQLKWNLVLSITIFVIFAFEPQKLFAKEVSIGTVHAGNRGYTNNEGLSKGSSFEILNAIVKKAGLTYENHLFPFPRVIRNLEAGEVDLALLVPNDVVNQVAIPLIEIQDVDFILVSKKGFAINTLADIKGKAVGYLRLTPTAKKVIGNLDIEKVDGGKYTHLVEMLMRGRIDVLFGPKSTIYWALNELGYSAKDLDKPLSIHHMKLHLVYSKQSANEQNISAIKAAAKQLKKDNIIQDIINKYDYSLAK